MRTYKVRVERTTTETADIEVTIDEADLREWGGDDADVTEYLEADRDWPENIRGALSEARWRFSDDEIDLRDAERSADA